MPRLTITVPDHDPTSFHFDLERKLLSIGRDENSGVTLNHSSISTQHSELMRVEGGYILRDLHSLNGTLLEGKRMMVVDFNRDAHAYIGDVRLDISFSKAEENILAGEKFSSMQTTEDPNEDPPEQPKPAKAKLPEPDASKREKSTLPKPSLTEVAPNSAPNTVAAANHSYKVAQKQSGGGFLSFIFRSILALAAVLAGFAYRH